MPAGCDVRRDPGGKPDLGSQESALVLRLAAVQQGTRWCFRLLVLEKTDWVGGKSHEDGLHPPAPLRRDLSRTRIRAARYRLSDDASREDGWHPPLVGIDGTPAQTPVPRRGDLKPALARLGDFFPGQLLLATDFDGTLAPIVPNPAGASALPANLALLDRMVELGVHVAVISGRAQQDLRQRLPISGPRLMGDNGISDTTDDERRALDRFNRKAGRLVALQPGVWIERKPGSTSIHYRNAPDAGPMLRAGLLPIADGFGLVTAMGRMVVEVRPQRADKARAVSILIKGIQPKAIIYAGDDEPDHSVFRMLSVLPRPHLTVGVSSDERPVTSFRECDLVVEGPQGMSAFLHRLLERVARRNSSP